MSKINDIKCCWALDTITESEIAEKTEDLIAKCRDAYNEIAELKFEDVTYNNVIKKLADVESDFLVLRAPLEFRQYVSTIKELRIASTAASQKFEQFDIEMSIRKNIFDKVVYFQQKNKFKMHTLDPEAKRYVERLIKIGKRNGLNLPYKTQVKINEIKKKISELINNFQHNLNEENTILKFTDKQLQGLPDDFINSLEKLEYGNRKVTLKYQCYSHIMRKCQIPFTRRAIDKAYHSRCIEENVPIIEELISLRQKHAELLDYSNHSAYITEMLMAKTPTNVANFLNDLITRLQPLWAKEKEVMMKLKEDEYKTLGMRFDGKLNYWDLHYYMAMIEEKMYAVDQNKLKEYFPFDIVTNGMLEIYKQILGLRFEEIKDGETWHPDVQLFRVLDTINVELLGYFYMDFFQREGKYGHTAVFRLQRGCIGSDNQRQLPVVAMLTNFSKPTQDKPSLLDHKEVEIYFHEFGHVMHYICAKTKFSLFSGTKVERDFEEAPSQMLENWVWEAKPLKHMSSHYKTGEPLPDEIIEILIESRKANAGIFTLRQIVLAMFDQIIHTRGDANTAQIFNNIFKEIIGISAIDGTNMAAGFEHIASSNGYDAQYYRYLWSEVLSSDIFYSRFKEDGIMNPSVGRDYRKSILEPGGSLDADVMLENFLGHKPNKDAFLKSKGVE